MDQAGRVNRLALPPEVLHTNIIQSRQGGKQRRRQRRGLTPPRWRKIDSSQPDSPKITHPHQRPRSDLGHRVHIEVLQALQPIRLHAMMSTLAFQATVLVRILAGEVDWMRWMVRKVD